MLYEHQCTFILFFLKILFLFLDRGAEREKERERNINMLLPLVCPLLGTWPATQACALTGNPTGDPLVHRPALNPLSHPSQGLLFSFSLQIVTFQMLCSQLAFFKNLTLYFRDYFRSSLHWNQPRLFRTSRYTSTLFLTDAQGFIVWTNHYFTSPF